MRKQRFYIHASIELDKLPSDLKLGIRVVRDIERYQELSFFLPYMALSTIVIIFAFNWPHPLHVQAIECVCMHCKLILQVT